jgi:hypothetical protein
MKKKGEEYWKEVNKNVIGTKEWWDNSKSQISWFLSLNWKYKLCLLLGGFVITFPYLKYFYSLTWYLFKLVLMVRYHFPYCYFLLLINVFKKEVI